MGFCVNLIQFRLGCAIRDSGFGMLDAGYWILDAGYWILDARYWMNIILSSCDSCPLWLKRLNKYRKIR